MLVVQVEDLIAIELAYINTNHPDFIGGKHAAYEAILAAKVCVCVCACVVLYVNGLLFPTVTATAHQRRSQQGGQQDQRQARSENYVPLYTLHSYVL